MKKIMTQTAAGLIALLMGAMVLTACGVKAAAAPDAASNIKVTSDADNQSNEETEQDKNKDERKTEITISAAASMKEAMGEIEKLYKTVQPDAVLIFNFGSSGSLQQQIEQGAPVDIFLSAGLKQMKVLEEKGLLAEGTEKELLENEVVLISPKDKTDLKGFEDLETEKVKRVGLGEPKSVPAGQYADEVLKKLGISDQVTPKAVYGKDVKEVLAWVEAGEADAGIVYATDAKASDKINIVCTAPKGSHKPVIYPIAVIKGTKRLQESKAFIDFLSSKEAQQVFENHGFIPK